MEKDDTVYLRHILDAIDTIQEYLQGVHEEKFKATRLLQDGAIRQIEIIGEAVRHMSKDIRRTYLKSHGRISLECEISLFMTISVLILRRFGTLHNRIYQR